jgi:nucleoid-associated protein EbfC
MKNPLSGLMQQAQQMQEKMAAAQAEIARLEVTGSAGAGLVEVTLNGRHETRRVKIDREMLSSDPEMVEDLIAAAFNDAVNKLAEASQQKLGQVTQGLNLPAGFKMPF